MGGLDVDVGLRVHTLLAGLAGRDGVSAEDVLVGAARLLRESPVGMRPFGSAVQRVAGLTGIGLWFRPPAPWRLTGAEAALGVGRADLIWKRGGRGVGPAGLVLVDEVKVMGIGGQVDDGAAVRQVSEYLAAGVRRWGASFVGVRLLVLSAPRRSLFFPAGDGSRPEGQALADTPFWFGPQFTRGAMDA